MKNVFNFVLLVMLCTSVQIFAQRNSSYKHAITIDAFEIAQSIGSTIFSNYDATPTFSIAYEYFDGPKRGIAGQLTASFPGNEIPLSGLIERRYYLSESNRSGFVAPYFSYVQTQGNYTYEYVNDDEEIIVEDDTPYKARGANLGVIIGYQYLAYSGFTADVEFGYGFPVTLDIDWSKEPSSKAEDTLKSIIPLVFNLKVGYSF